jgi:hypothetical protein
MGTGDLRVGLAESLTLVVGISRGDLAAGDSAHRLLDRVLTVGFVRRWPVELPGFTQPW